jgi:DNA-binding protein HU-beta
MNKGDLIKKIAADGKLTKKQASAALESVINNVTGSLKKGERVTLIGFGTFSVIKRAARAGRNPQTGKPLKIAARKVAKFKAGATLAKKVK